MFEKNPPAADDGISTDARTRDTLSRTRYRRESLGAPEAWLRASRNLPQRRMAPLDKHHRARASVTRHDAWRRRSTPRPRSVRGPWAGGSARGLLDHRQTVLTPRPAKGCVSHSIRPAWGTTCARFHAPRWRTT